MATIQEFIRAHRITMRCDYADSNPNMPNDYSMDHWRCVLRATDGNGKRHSFTVYFSQGFGHGGKEPRIADVLDCLASDASGYENARHFEDWADEYGYDTDSRKAERTYKAIGRQVQGLKRLLGDAAYNTLLWETERI